MILQGASEGLASYSSVAWVEKTRTVTISGRGRSPGIAKQGTYMIMNDLEDCKVQIVPVLWLPSLLFTYRECQRDTNIDISYDH